MCSEKKNISMKECPENLPWPEVTMEELMKYVEEAHIDIGIPKGKGSRIPFHDVNPNDPLKTE